MTADPIRFEDGQAYERFMGAWSQLAGAAFLDWLQPAAGLRWLDVGCGNGAFTELIVRRGASASIAGIDPSPAQLAFAHARFAPGVADLRQGDAMALPFDHDVFDVAVMPLVIFFVSDPAKGVAEMARVVRPGGTVAAYAWDMEGQGFPYEPLLNAIRGLGMTVPEPPSPRASRIDVMQELWAGAGLVSIETTAITVQRTFADFEDYWTAVFGSPSAGARLSAMSPEQRRHVQELMRAELSTDAAGHIICTGRANAVRGTAPRRD